MTLYARAGPEPFEAWNFELDYVQIPGNGENNRELLRRNFSQRKKKNLNFLHPLSMISYSAFYTMSGETFAIKTYIDSLVTFVSRLDTLQETGVFGLSGIPSRRKLEGARTKRLFEIEES